MKWCSFYLLIIILFVAVSAEAEQLKPFIFPSARASGFGGIHAAQGDDISAIFSNPASFSGIKKQFSAAELTVSVYGPIFEMLDKAVTSSGDLSSVIDSDNFTAGFDIGGPIAFGLVNDGFGVGFFIRSTADAEAVSLPIVGRVLLPSVSEEVLLVGGFSFRVMDNGSHTLDMGVLGKGFYRFLFNIEMPVIDITDFSENSQGVIRPFQTQFGMGIDLGIKYTFAGNFSVAVVGYDVFSPAMVTEYDNISDYGKSSGYQSYGYVQPRLALGFLYRIESEFLERSSSEITLMADYRDFINLFKKDRRHPLLDLSLGMELTLLNILKLRAGMADALPCGGFGIDMTFMTFDAAVRGKALGDKPGDKTVFAMDIGLLFRY